MSSSLPTPLYQALHAERYARQSAIKSIEESTKRRLIVYFANIAKPGSEISLDDVSGFGDLLNDINGEDLDLFIQSGGGDIDAAEKLIYMIRQRARGFRVVVPNLAKSAATLIALAADSIVMSYTSELGPIDPQIRHRNADGSFTILPAQSFLDGVESIKKAALKDGGLSPAYFPLLTQLNPALLDFCEKARERSKLFAKKWLCQGMLSGDHAQAEKVATELCDAKRFLSHGAVVDVGQAEAYKLKVEKLDPNSDLWQAFWRLYTTYEICARQQNVAKMFESRVVALTLS